MIFCRGTMCCSSSLHLFNLFHIPASLFKLSPQVSIYNFASLPPPPPPQTTVVTLLHLTLRQWKRRMMVFSLCCVCVRVCDSVCVSVRVCLCVCTCLQDKSLYHVCTMTHFFHWDFIYVTHQTQV